MLCLLGRYEEAIEDLNRIIESHPKFVLRNDWFLYTRALAYLALNQADNAKSDLDRAIYLAHQQYNDNPDAHWNTLNLAIYYVVANKLEQAKHFYSDALRRGAPQAQIQEAVQDLENFLKVFPHHRAAQQIREVLMKRIGDS